MQKTHDFAVQATFRALSDSTRREILLLLKGKDLTIAQIAQNFTMTRAGVKKHLHLLEQGGLVSITVKGRERINHLEMQAFQIITDWIGSVDGPAQDRLDTLRRNISREWNSS